LPGPSRYSSQETGLSCPKARLLGLSLVELQKSAKILMVQFMGLQEYSKFFFKKTGQKEEILLNRIGFQRLGEWSIMGMSHGHLW